MNIKEAIAAAQGSYIVPSHPIFKASVRKFHKNKLIKKFKKKKKKNLKESVSRNDAVDAVESGFVDIYGEVPEGPGVDRLIDLVMRKAKNKEDAIEIAYNMIADEISDDEIYWSDEEIPKDVKASKAEIERLEKHSKKLPTKKLKLKEETEDFDKLIKGGSPWLIYHAGINWKQFDYEKGLDALIKTGDARKIYNAGVSWKQFDYEKGLDALIKIGKADYIYDAGRDWKQFDYEKGISFLKRKSVSYYEAALRNWPKGVKQSKAEIEKLKRTSKKLPTKKLKLKESVSRNDAVDAVQIAFVDVYGNVPEGPGVDALINSVRKKAKNRKDAIEIAYDMIVYEIGDAEIYWGDEEAPKDVKASKAEIKRLEKYSKKLPTKKLKLKEATEDFDDLLKSSAYSIWDAGLNWKQFDYEKGLDALIKIGDANYIYSAGRDWKRFNYEKGLDALIKTGITNYIYSAGRDWKRFNYEKGLDALIKSGSADYVYLAGKSWKQFNYEKGLNFLKKNSKPYYQSALRHWPRGIEQSKAEIERLEKHSKKLPTRKLKLKEATEDFDELIKTGDAYDIYGAGRDWKQFNYEKGLNALIKLGKANYICRAGREWEQFDYKKGLDALIKIGEAESIYYAGTEWKQFNYEKGLDALIKIGKANYVSYAGAIWKQFDYKKGLSFLKGNSKEYYELALKDWPKGVKQSKAEIKRLERDSKKLPTKKLKLKEATEDFDELIKSDDALAIYRAGRHWKQFNYEEGLDALIKTDNATYVYRAGVDWKQFDYKKGLDALIKAGDANHVYHAGTDWKQFNYEKGLDLLIKIGDANHVYFAGVQWKEFNYEKGINFLKRKSKTWYEAALKAWPKGVKEAKAKIEKLKKTSKKLPTKPLKLKEALQLVKFHYSNYKHDKRPRVKALDYEYPGRPEQKTYGKRKDLLGWNINYFSNRRYARRAIDEIDSFARLLGAHGEEKYKRVKYFFPEQAKYIRRYMRKHIKGLKRKRGMLWRKTTYDDLVKFDRESL